MKLWQSLLVTFCLILAVVGSASAQSNAEINAGTQFNFSTPGARSLGLGGAFIGLADDATAAYSNPAGLTVLARPEISFEGRSWDYTTRFTQGGRQSGMVTGNGLDQVDGLLIGDSTSSADDLSFLSFVYPKKRWALAVYRHQLANYQASFETEGAFFSADNRDLRFFPVQANTDLTIVNTGVSFAFRLSENFSIGIGASSYDFEIQSLTERFDFVGFEAVSFVPMNVVNFQEQEGDDDDVAGTLGFLWNLGKRVSLGGVYRQGPEFDLVARSTSGPSRGSPGTVFEELETAMSVPDVWGLGLVFRVTDTFTVALDVAKVEYSSLTESTANLFSDSFDDATSRLRIDDGTEIHLGFEYVLVGSKLPVALRFGGWLDPDHAIAFRGPAVTAEEVNLSTLFREGDDEIHYSVGLGLVFGEKFQLDLAADFSELVDTASISGVVRF